MPVVDVEAVLSSMQANQGQELNWRTSIVDLMKLLGLDSSLAARKELATELHYSGNTEDSAAMNMWLHKAVMQKLAQNGGKVPDDLKD
jgi:RNase P/RNase MRP subunit p30